MNLTESIVMALDSIRVNKLRAFLTLLSISIGVFAIIGAGTLITALNNTVEKQMESIGENTFWFEKMPHIQTGDSWHKYMKRKPITYSQLKDLKRRMTLTEIVSGVGVSPESQTIKSGNLSTDPDVTLIGADDMYFETSNIEVESGRPFAEDDIILNRNVAVIGNDVVVKVFPGQNPIGRKISVKNQNFTVIGVLKVKGAVLGRSQDNYVFIPVSQFLKYYASEWEESLTVLVKPKNRELRDATIDEAVGAMRIIRNIKPGEENTFEVETNESITEQFGPFVGFLTYFGIICGGIALIAAGVGITNIMLVSVKERTREIGIRKAVGAKRSSILFQFIIETITLCQIGGLFGIILGVGGAGLLGAAAGMVVAMPVTWIVGSLLVCTLLGVFSGSYPAWKAANLDPIDALRYE